jgi:outer membrane lipoprotein SlyB
MTRTLAPLALAVLLAGCSTTSPDVVSPNEAQRLAQVQDAVVLNVRPVVVEGSQSGGGALTGAAIGGLAGSQRSSGKESAIIGIAGAVVGAVVGNAVERSATREDAVEVLVQLKNGERRSIVQAKGNETLAPGDPVILVTTSGKTRVTKAPPVAAAPKN